MTKRYPLLTRVLGWTLILILAPLWVPLLLVLVALLVPVTVLGNAVKGWLLARSFRNHFFPQGRRGVLMYSRSPNWQPYIDGNWLPKIADRVVLVDWSDRSHWQGPLPLAVRVARHWGGGDNFNPLAVVFPPRGKPRVIRFYRPFLAFKHGKPSELQEAEAQLFSLLLDESHQAA